MPYPLRRSHRSNDCLPERNDNVLGSRQMRKVAGGMSVAQQINCAHVGYGHNMSRIWSNFQILKSSETLSIRSAASTNLHWSKPEDVREWFGNCSVDPSSSRSTPTTYSLYLIHAADEIWQKTVCIISSSWWRYSFCGAFILHHCRPCHHLK